MYVVMEASNQWRKKFFHTEGYLSNVVIEEVLTRITKEGHCTEREKTTWIAL